MTANKALPPSGFRGRVVAEGDSAVSNANIANIITVVRILLTPLFIYLLLLDGGDDGLWRWVAAGLFILAIATDGVDGALARRRNLVTSSGIILDPIADLALVGELPWWVVAVIVVREVGITVFRFAHLRHRAIPASRGGKLKTILQSVTVSSWLLPSWVFLGDWVLVMNQVLMGVVILVTVWTGVEYLLKGSKAPRSADE